MEDLISLIRKRRTIRQFQPAEVPLDILFKLTDLGRLAPSASNLQPLEFLVVTEKELRKQVFSCLRWAAYINPAGDPKPEQEPTAYIIILVNTQIRTKGFEYDIGAAAENIILGGLSAGLGCCWLISVDRDRLQPVLKVPETLKIDSVIALGYPAEQPVAEEYSGSVKYWKDETGCLHVPKRSLKDVSHLNFYGQKFPDSLKV
ncbi:MAG: nitroreductase family protein [Candidatus Saccharicenans sp.]|jgi:nitroreductase|nr:nitroreductase family protein [Candidatus Saccharicenans sp.]NMC66421.1 nitroreductase [Acidobacteriota bacterium]